MGKNELWDPVPSGKALLTRITAHASFANLTKSLSPTGILAVRAWLGMTALDNEISLVEDSRG